MSQIHKRHQYKFFKDTIIIFFATVFFVGGPIVLANWQIKQSRLHTSPIELIKNIQLKEGTHALRFLASYGFNLKEIRRNKAPVPEVYFANLPRELPHLKNTKLKKELFFSSLLPPILKVNEIILQNRQRLKKVILQITLGEKVSEFDYYWLAQMLERYKVKVRDVQDFLDRTEEILDQLLLRMNIIPPELALAQAAQESGWGTSRFSQQGNALYGQWTWGDGCGMVPKQREEGKTHRMKCFKSIIAAVDSYMLNLNTHRAYNELRLKRRTFRDDQIIKVTPLVETLINYSEEGQDYVIKIKNIIRVNKLTDFTEARLRGQENKL